MKQFSINSVLLFLLGLGAGLRVHIIGLIGLSEIVAFVLAPFLFLKHHTEFKRAGFLTFYNLIFMMMIGSLISSAYNHTWMFASIKNCAVLYSIFAYSVVLFLLLRKSFTGIGWLFAGSFLASIVVVWAFNTALHVDASVGTAELSESTVEDVVTGVRFWNTRIASLLRLPVVSTSYLRLPIAYPLIALPLGTIVCIVMSISGRSDALILMFAFILIAIARKSRKRMMIFGRHWVVFLLGMLLVTVAAKNAYKYAAVSGYLGEHAKAKYYGQTKQGDSVLRLLMAGRAEFFIGLRAALDHPIVGFGTMAPDDKGYWAEFLWKYADHDDYDLFMRLNARNEQYGGRLQIPVHSYIVSFWGQSGIIGLVFSIYITYLVFQYFRHYAQCIPHWYGFFSCTIPSLAWSMFFSPYGHGVTMPMLFTGLLMARAVGRGWLVLPEELEIEARRYE